jgi:hypothetical protein
MGTQSLKLAAERDIIQLLLLQQLPLQLFHLTRPLVDLACARSKFLLLLDDDIGPGLGRSVQLLRISECTPGVDVTQFDSLRLQVETTLMSPCLHPLGNRCLLEHGGPQLEAPKLVSEISVFPAQHTLHLRQGPESRAHSPIQGNVIRSMAGGMPHDHLWFPHHIGSCVCGCGGAKR